MEGKNTQEDRGLQCHACGCRHLMVDNTRKATRMIIRYRRCRQCGARATTCERMIGSHIPPPPVT